MRTRILMVVGMAAVAGLGALGLRALVAEEKPAEGDVESVQKAYAFTLPDQNGKDVTMSQFRGKIVVLEWVNFDCPISLRHYERGTFNRLCEKYGVGGPKAKVVWLAINSTHYWDIERNKKAAEKYKVRYPILDDHEGKVGGIYKAKTTPHMFIKAPDGALVYEGAIDDDPGGQKEEPLNYVEQAIDELLAGKAVSVPQTKPYGCTVKYAKR